MPRNQFVYTKRKQSIFIQSVWGSLFIIAIGIPLIYKGTKPKSEFYKISSQVTYIASQFEELPYNDSGDYRYLQIKDYPKTFEIYTGNGSIGKAKLEHIDLLKRGDNIDVYYDIDNFEKDLRLNRDLMYIDRNKTAVYICGDKYKQLGIGLTTAGVVILLGLFYLKLTNKIE